MDQFVRALVLLGMFAWGFAVGHSATVSWRKDAGRPFGRGLGWRGAAIALSLLMAGFLFGFITDPEDPDPSDWSPLIAGPAVFGYVYGIVWVTWLRGGGSGATPDEGR